VIMRLIEVGYYMATRALFACCDNALSMIETSME